MELSKNYEPSLTEGKWYQYWNDKKYFSSKPDNRPAYTIVIPPPNVTGVLHMGHALNNAVQDVLIRYARQQGYNTCWVPGTDHASIATEAKVAAMLREQGIDKNNLSREEFLQHAWQWKEKYGGIILQQLKKLGCALDWDRTAFTMDPDYYNAVIDVFIDLYHKGYIYRGVKMINWDPKAKTALSDEEVIHKEVNSKLYYIKYFLDNDGRAHQEECITVATVRPETILGDTAVCVHPQDPRYQHLIGKKCYVPLINRAIPIIADEYIEMDFGTGCLKVTPAHDINDYNLGIKHGLAVIDTLNEDGTMSEAAGMYIGMDRFEVRKKIVEDMQAAGNVLKIEDYKNQVGYSERTDVVIEPRLSMQWWCKMEQMAKPALEKVMNDEIQFYPSKFKNTYKHWMGNIKDWCISRQLRWGHRIPAWYDTDGNIIIAKNETDAYSLYELKYGKKADKLVQDDDVLDTWFSSWLWPMEVFGWNKQKENNQDLSYYYPTATLVTAPEIIFFWVARMIMAGLEYKNEIPFRNVYFTGIVRDKQGRKMSKSLGNSPDLLLLIDQYGADAVRFGVLIASPAGNDLLFDENGIEQGKIFGNKIWNALKLLQILQAKKSDAPLNNGPHFADKWFAHRLYEVQQAIAQDIKEYRLSEALKKIYTLIWDDYCSWYLEWIKPPIDQPIDINTIQNAYFYFGELMKMLHPFMPFITEEVFHHLFPHTEIDIVNTQLETLDNGNPEYLTLGATLKEIITHVRDIKVKQGLKPKEEVMLFLPQQFQHELENIVPIMQKQTHANEIVFVNEKTENTIGFVIGKYACALRTFHKVDNTAQRIQLEKEKEYLLGFLQSVEKKLSNEKFVQNARPEIIENENRKKTDALEKLRNIEECINLL